MVITAETPVRDIATAIPTTIPVLERLKIDYCCHGQHTLAEACQKRALKLKSVMEELECQQQPENKPEESHWLHAPLRELVGHVIKTHHAYTREQLKLIDELMAKVEQRHGAEHPVVFEVGRIATALSSELKLHTQSEEADLFPYLAAPEFPAPTSDNLDTPVAKLVTDHEEAGEKLATLRQLTNNYIPPAEACPTWRALYRAMEELEADLHQHIHLENNIMFPRALAAVAAAKRKKLVASPV